MLLDAFQLGEIFPEAGARVHVFCAPLDDAMAEVGIDTPHEIASFLAQIGHESNRLRSLIENLNYSDAGLLATWPKRFNEVTAARYARHPEMIADLVYAGRYGNGDEASGDGWRFRGKGLLQITFQKNHLNCGQALGLDLIGNPMLLIDPGIAARSAAWFWKVNGLDAEDDDDDVTRETRIVNGGGLGLADRQKLFDLALKVLS